MEGAPCLGSATGTGQKLSSFLQEEQMLSLIQVLTQSKWHFGGGGDMHSGATASQTLAYLGLNYSQNYPIMKSPLLSSFNTLSEKLPCRMALRTHASIGNCEWLHAECCWGSKSKLEPHCDPREHSNAAPCSLSPLKDSTDQQKHC